MSKSMRIVLADPLGGVLFSGDSIAVKRDLVGTPTALVGQTAIVGQGDGYPFASTPSPGTEKSMTIDAEGGWKAEERTGSRPRTPRVLVAEDDPAMRDLCVQSLRRDGYEVVEAASGAEAVAIMEDVSTREWSTDAIDLVLTDVRMPGLSGVRLGEMIRKARWPIPVILMTAFPDAAVEAEAGRLQLALLAKPFRLELMRRIVLTTLAAHVRARNSSSVEVPGAVAK